MKGVFLIFTLSLVGSTFLIAQETNKTTTAESKDAVITNSIQRASFRIADLLNSKEIDELTSSSFALLPSESKGTTAYASPSEVRRISAHQKKILAKLVEKAQAVEIANINDLVNALAASDGEKQEIKLYRDENGALQLEKVEKKPSDPTEGGTKKPVQVITGSKSKTVYVPEK